MHLHAHFDSISG